MQHTRPGDFFVGHSVHTLGNAGQGNANTYALDDDTPTPRVYLAGEQNRKKHKIGMEVHNTNAKSMFVLYGDTK